MKKILVGFSLVLACFQGFSQNINKSNKFTAISENYANKIVNAIYIVEGGNKTKFPYGIKSIKTNNPRRICLNTVKNNYIRWQKSGSKENYLDFLADKYCPPSVDLQGNINWKKNIKKLLDK